MVPKCRISTVVIIPVTVPATLPIYTIRGGRSRSRPGTPPPSDTIRQLRDLVSPPVVPSVLGRAVDRFRRRGRILMQLLLAGGRDVGRDPHLGLQWIYRCGTGAGDTAEVAVFGVLRSLPPFVAVVAAISVTAAVEAREMETAKQSAERGQAGAEDAAVELDDGQPG